MKLERLTVGMLKQILKDCNVPDNAIIACQSDEEGNRTMVCYDCFVDSVGKKHTIAGYDLVGGEEVMGIDLEKDKGRCFITFAPMF